MSELIVEVVEIDEVEKHPNADRLDIATVKGWQCIVQKDTYKPGNKVIYIPIDSILPAELEAKLFPPDSKITLSKSRIKTIRIRKAISQGMIISLEYAGLSDKVKVGTDVMKKLGITKYISPIKQPNVMSSKGKKSKKQKNPNFRKYTDIQHIKNYPKILVGKNIIITEKIHGTNYRAGRVKYGTFSLWKKFLKLFKDVPEYEFVFGSHKVQLQGLLNLLKKKPTFYKENVYLEAVVQYGLKSKLKDNEVIYAEIYGSPIQKGYTYGCKEGERKMVVFDVMIDGKYIDTEDAIQFCKEKDLPYVPVLYRGPYSQELLDKYVGGKSVLSKKQQVREGIVVTTKHEEKTYAGRAIFKYINPTYLLKDQSEFH